MDDDQKAKSLPGDFRKSFEALAHRGNLTKDRQLQNGDLWFMMLSNI